MGDINVQLPYLIKINSCYNRHEDLEIDIHSNMQR
jgi:hypothetical protein